VKREVRSSTAVARVARVARGEPRRRPRPAGRLKMRDVERLAGVGRETIRFYIREGLLPEPERPGRNVAWYDAAFVARVRLIKELQARRFLPLRLIKAILDGDAVPPPAGYARCSTSTAASPPRVSTAPAGPRSSRPSPVAPVSPRLRSAASCTPR
jgi:DNA-binding transcriptional MerR regulator